MVFVQQSKQSVGSENRYDEERRLAELSLRIYEYRELMGLTQQELAKRARITQQQLSKIENGVTLHCFRSTYIAVSIAILIRFAMKLPPFRKISLLTHLPPLKVAYFEVTEGGLF